jgi:hypothetical protein
MVILRVNGRNVNLLYLSYDQKRKPPLPDHFGKTGVITGIGQVFHLLYSSILRKPHQ